MPDLKHSQNSDQSVNMIRKDFAVEILHLISAGRPKDGLRFFGPDCKAHNPYVTGGMNALIESMVDVQKKGAEGITKGSRADFKLDV